MQNSGLFVRMSIFYNDWYIFPLLRESLTNFVVLLDNYRKVRAVIVQYYKLI